MNLDVLLANEEDYEKALYRLFKCQHVLPNTKQANEAVTLSLLIEHYENEHFPIEPVLTKFEMKRRAEELKNTF